MIQITLVYGDETPTEVTEHDNVVSALNWLEENTRGGFERATIDVREANPNDV